MPGIDPSSASLAASAASAGISGITSIIGLIAGLHGMKKAGEAQKELEGKQQGTINNEQSLANWYNNQSNKNFLDTGAASSVLGKLRDSYKTNLENADSNMAAGGATDEAKVATKGRLQDSYNKTLGNLVGYGTQYQDNMKKGYAGTLGTIYGMNNALYAPKVQSYSNLASNGFGVFGQGLNGVADAFDKKNTK